MDSQDIADVIKNCKAIGKVRRKVARVKRQEGEEGAALGRGGRCVEHIRAKATAVSDGGEGRTGEYRRRGSNEGRTGEYRRRG
eukprot:766526-Hanusia_phi.AAC.3